MKKIKTDVPIGPPEAGGPLHLAAALPSARTSGPVDVEEMTMMPILLQDNPKLKRESNVSNTLKNISLSSVVVCSEENLAGDLHGEAVLLNLKSGSYFGLNAMGTRIWQLIQKPAKVSEVYEELLTEYEIQPEECLKELLTFFRHLQANDLIQVRDTDEIMGGSVADARCEGYAAD